MSRALKKVIKEIEQSAVFDGDWYSATYPEVRSSGMTPAEHYVRIGVKKGYSPSLFFDTKYYLKHNPDVAEAGYNPLRHYLVYGENEGRKPNAFFDVRAFREKHNPEEENALEYFARYVREHFDAVFYKEFYQLTEDPLRHYIQTGYLTHVPCKQALEQQSIDTIQEVYFDLTEEARAEFYSPKYADCVLLLSGVQQVNGVYVWRIKFLQEYLELHGVKNVYAECIDSLSDNFYQILHSCRCVIYTSPKVGALHGQLLGEILRLKKKLIIDIDDLFDSDYAKYFGAVKSKLRECDNVEHIILQTEYTFNYPDAIMVSTDFLAEKLARYGKPIFVRRNAISPGYLKPLKKKARKDTFSLLLASGTATHNYDISTIYPDLLNFLKKHPEVEINVLGKADAAFTALPNKQHHLELLPYEEMLECFAENDLLLVPLEKNPFNDAKSNIKFIEAACGMTPVLAQNCREFLVIQDGVTGYLYDDDFFEKLEYIYAHRDSLPEVGYAARQYVEKHMTTACNACPELIDFINN